MGYNSKGGQKYELRKRAKPINISMLLCLALFLRGFSMSPPPATAGGVKIRISIADLDMPHNTKEEGKVFLCFLPYEKDLFGALSPHV